MYALQTGRRFPAPMNGASLGEVSTGVKYGIGAVIGLGLLFAISKTRLGKKVLRGPRLRRRRR